jgi:hypothetical protein
MGNVGSVPRFLVPRFLNDKNQPFDYEVLHNSAETNPPFQSEYGNDPPK